MQFTLAALAFALGASASVLPRACTFTLSASGGVSGTIWQLGDGQVRVGGGSSTATFSINGNKITDSSGRGCILTPPTTQFQCDTGATPTSGFSINSKGMLEYSGSTTFYACPATTTQYNIYTKPVPGQTKCVTVTLTASGCAAPAPAPAKPASSAKPVTSVVPVHPVSSVAPAKPASTPAKTCPTTLSGSYQFPHLIIPVDSTKPTTAAGTSYNGKITSTVSSIFNFDIPSSYTGTCSLVFLFPTQSQLQTSSYTFSGPGTVGFTQLNTVATQSTTYANQGSVKTDFGTKTVTPGTSTVISTFACPAGKAVSYELKSVGGTSLTYFQDYNPSPIGLYITAC